MPTSAPGNRSFAPRVRAAGSTLIELMVVLSIIAIAAAGISFALRDAAGAPLDRDAQRLAALLESARARSRLTGQPVRWVAQPEGFRFDGLPRDALPNAWLDSHTQVVGRGVLVLGPEPVIPPQAVVLASSEHPDRALRIATDGVRPFAVANEQP
jgi:general secretion pathway protein H